MREAADPYTCATRGEQSAGWSPYESLFLDSLLKWAAWTNGKRNTDFFLLTVEQFALSNHWPRLLATMEEALLAMDSGNAQDFRLPCPYARL